jgi:hypothetical protein
MTKLSVCLCLPLQISKSMAEFYDILHVRYASGDKSNLILYNFQQFIKTTRRMHELFELGLRPDPLKTES